ncbi:ATP-binding protein [Streptomyces sp. NPDC006692]|uniref:ATP-binding protein n=1 Tax=unclassified Streptomyces TaxID=2593676 RepID=UPI00367E6813
MRAAHEQWFARITGPGEPTSVEDRKWPARLRHQSRGLLTHWGLDRLVDIVDTPLTEMVTNALVHGGGGDIGFRMIRTDRGVRVEVADSSPASASALRASPDEEHGRGLLMVQAFSDSWGTRARGGGVGKWMWAYFATAAGKEVPR